MKGIPKRMNALRLQLATVLLAGLFVLGGYASAVAASADTQTVSGGGVTVAVTYTNPRAAEAPRFAIILNTHSVDLDGYDFKTLTLLRDEAGKTYAPTKVENKGSGHHRQVAMTFPKITEGAKRVEIIIKDVAGVKERIFRWNFK
jgi:hypothetical protein